MLEMKLPIDNLEISLAEHGSGDPVLLLHGFPLSSDLWTPTMERLSGWRLLAPDMRGHGASEVADDASMPRLAADQIALLDALDVSDPVVVVGLSMGGYVALEIARRWPERVRALVLVDTRSTPDDPEAAEGRRTTAARVLEEGSGGFAEEMAGKIFSPSTSTALVGDWRERMARTAPAGIAAALRGMADRAGSDDVLRAWERPLLIVVGEDDSVTPPPMAERMHSMVPGAELVVIPRAGHLPPVEQPDHFADALRTFLDRLPPLP
jgi:pimeloyl-ACP methyl ester carboxylesterase